MSTPHNAVKFFPRISKVISVKINNVKLLIIPYHHIADMIISVLISSRATAEQISVSVNVINEGLPIFVLDRTFFIHLDFVVYFTIKIDFPIFYFFRSGDFMNFF